MGSFIVKMGELTMKKISFFFAMNDYVGLNIKPGDSTGKKLFVHGMLLIDVN